MSSVTVACERPGAIVIAPNGPKEATIITLGQQYLGVAFIVGSEAASVKAWHLGTVVIPRRSITGRPSSRSEYGGVTMDANGFTRDF